MKSIDALCWWLEHTALSQTIQSINWIVPAIQTIHILAITVVAASALMIDLRLIGVFSADRPLREVSARFLPLIWWPLLVLLVTGLVVTALYQLLLRRDPGLGSPASPRRGTATAIATLSMLLWTGIIF